MNKVLNKRIENVLSELKAIIIEIQENKLQNEQFTLNFMDELNKLSVTF